jgi:hypothetical protein
MEYYSDSTNESASSVWNRLNRLEDKNGTVIIESINSNLYINTFPIINAPSTESPFLTQNAVDSGTLYVPFTNGMSLAYSRAVMAAEPTDKNLHNSDTITMCYHTPNPLAPDLSSDLLSPDGSSYSSIIMTTISDLPDEDALYETALYSSEGSHALKWANSVKDILVLDGPIFPVGLLAWFHGKPNLKNLLSSNGPSRLALKTYIDLIDSFVKPVTVNAERSPPLIGFVKNPRSTAIKSTLDHLPNDTNSFIWPHDSSFFKQILRSHISSKGQNDVTTHDSALAYTNWFISKSRIASQFEKFLTDPFIGITDQQNSLYDLTFFMIYDPRSDLVYRVESPYAFSQNPSIRQKIENFILKEMAIYNGPPRVINKADHLAHMSNSEKENLGRLLATHFNTRMDINYNFIRWNSMDQLRNL